MRIQQALQDFGTKIDVFRPNERTDAAAVVALLDLVPPAVDLVAHHGGLLDEKHAALEQAEQMMLGAGDGRKELPAGEDADASRGCSFDRHLLFFRACTFGDLDTLFAESRMDGRKQVFRYGRFGERQKLGFVEAGLRTLRFRIEFADGIDLVAEEFDTHGAIGFGRVDIEDASAAGELAGHLDQVHLGVAHAGEVAGEDFDVDLFATAHGDGEAGVVIATEEPKGGGLGGRNENGDCASGEFEQGSGALLLHVGVRREVLEWEHIVGGDTDYTIWIDCSGEFTAGAECEFESFGGLVIGHDNDDGLLGGASEKWDVKRTGSIRESGHTSATDTKREVPANAIKGGGLLQFRENFADKREDHAVLVYQGGLRGCIERTALRACRDSEKGAD